MNQAELIANLSETSGAQQKTIKDVLAAMGSLTRDVLARGEPMTLPGIGTVKVKERSARTGRNPATGDPIQIAAKRVVRLVPSKVLKDALD